ncbi:hypothetical protein H4R20_001119 [Coemansia guatemalensis]|uniref:lytic cellulose monooxygenase (C4-dehydrogenating) n=1 Tax=Coemansia guatemalensis TaxID=2761395 RepID=A0A9W8LUU0_9FUNG|nr:hypothetical protein H4R20_001119 [Coemansia guatemalensis]
MMKYIRPYYDYYNGPVTDVNSPDLVCRTSDMNPKNTDTRDVSAGATVGLIFKADDLPGSMVFDPRHVGPCLVYMAPMSSNGKGDVWFKIFEQGYNLDTGKWCSDHVIAADGQLDVTIPADIADGEYLLRGEIITLQNALDIGGAQFYANCVQIRVSGGGSATPSGVRIPGVYKKDHPGIHFDVYETITGYTIPGPTVYVADNAGSSKDDNDDVDFTSDTDHDSDTTAESESSSASGKEQDGYDEVPSESESDTSSDPGSERPGYSHHHCPKAYRKR